MDLPSKRITPDRAVLLGMVVATLVYLQDLRYDFILDDVPTILLNESVQSLRNWKTAFVTQIFSEATGITTGKVAIHYRPVYKLWQMLNEQLFGSVLPWWHFTSLLLHIGVVLLVYRVGVVLLQERWSAALAALLFAVHPIHAESVAYVSGSTDLLVAVFALLSFLAYFHYREQHASPVYLVASVLAAALAIMSKENAAMIPWMLVAYEALRETPAGAKRDWKRYLWTIPYFAVVAAYVVARTALFGVNTGAAPGGSRLAAFVDIPLVLVTYLRNLFWPFRLSFFYPREWSSEWTALNGIAAALVIFAGAYLWRRYRDQKGVRLQLLWAGIFFVPSLLGVFTFVHEDWVHDRHMYLVSVPICLVVATLLTDRRWSVKASVGIASAVLFVLVVDLAVQVPRFADNNTIYESALKVAPRSLLLHTYYGTALLAYGRTEDSLREYRIATELAPQLPEPHAGYASALVYAGRYDEAMTEYQKALEFSTQSAVFHAYVLSRVAALELKLSKYEQAEAQLREAVNLAPDVPDYYALLAQALNCEGQTQEANEAMRLEASLRQRAARERSPSKD